MPRGWRDYLFWQASDPKMVVRINALLEDMRRSPFRGIGKPEPLGENWAGWWSRRIDNEHRLVYRVIGKGDEQRLEIAQCRYHY
jgi:toxin YoeB